jgi:hypothetical protein
MVLESLKSYDMHLRSLVVSNYRWWQASFTFGLGEANPIYYGCFEQDMEAEIW